MAPFCNQLTWALALALLLSVSRGAESAPAPIASLPLVLVADVPLPGRPVRFDYQDIDTAKGRLFIAHMNDASLVVVDIRDGKLLKVISGIPTPRGVAVAADAKRAFVTSSPKQLVIIDTDSLTELTRVETGRAPDGVAWDPSHQVVGVSDQRDGALSLIDKGGTGARRQVALGSETGNVVFDRARGLFWITVVPANGPDLLVAVDPLAAKVSLRIPLPGCSGAHGLRIHPNGASALIACEENSKVLRVELAGAHPSVLALSGAAPDVLALDTGLDWLYVAAESGDVRIFDVSKPGLTLLGREHPGSASHSVAVDSTTHRVFFPLSVGPNGTPVLRIMHPTGT